MRKKLTRNITVLLVLSILFSCSYHNKMRFVKVQKKKPQEQVENTQVVATSKDQTTEVIEAKRLPAPQTPMASTQDRVQESTVSITTPVISKIKKAPKAIVDPVDPVDPEIRKNTSPQLKKENEQNEKDASLWLALTGLGMSLALGLVLIKKKDSAVKLSHWAKRNKRTSIGIIIVSKLAMAGAGLYFGKLLLDSGVHISTTFTHSLSLTMLLAGITYPRKHSIRGFWKHSYLKQKTHDLALTLCGFFLLTSISNQSNFTFKNQSADTHISTQQQADAKRSFQSDVRGANSFKSYEYQPTKVSVTQEKDESSNGIKVLKTLFLVALVVFLSALLSVLVCGLSCNGQELAALVVGTAGIMVIGALLIFGLRGIWRKRAPKKEPEYQVK